jgi:hypothetical protein
MIEWGVHPLLSAIFPPYKGRVPTKGSLVCMMKINLSVIDSSLTEDTLLTVRLSAGAGKTTLVERILNAQHGYRIAVILNEIGDTHGIEKALLQDEGGVLCAV